MCMKPHTTWTGLLPVMDEKTIDNVSDVYLSSSTEKICYVLTSFSPI